MTTDTLLHERTRTSAPDLAATMAEIGISTQRLPPRGPVGAAELTTYKYLVRGSGQVRP